MEVVVALENEGGHRKRDMESNVKIWKCGVGGNNSTYEKVCAHPSLLEVVRCGLMSKDMDEQFPTWLQSSSNLCHKQLIVLHMLKELDLVNH